VRALFWIACAAVAVLTLMPSEQLPTALFSWWDKLQHALAFGTLALLGGLAYSPLRAAAGVLIFGVAIEIVQEASGWRHGDVVDALADGVGVAAGLIVATWLSRRSRRHAGDGRSRSRDALAPPP
jgi:VanZ family protein